ncbi:MAG: hypothetical protein Q9191_000435 [Dirinaria sp. TL-2023a]
MLQGLDHNPAQLRYEVSHRMRKLKCDEQRPRCGQCCKANRECQLSSGIVFRHHHNASMNASSDPQAGGSSSTSTLNGFYAYRNTFDEDSVWLDIPKQITFVNTTSPYADDLHYSITPSQVTEKTPNQSQQQTDWSETSKYQGGGTAKGLEALSAAALHMPNSAINASNTVKSAHAIPHLNTHEQAASAKADSEFSSMSSNDIGSNLNSCPEQRATAIDPALEIPYPPMCFPPDVSESSQRNSYRDPI